LLTSLAVVKAVWQRKRSNQLNHAQHGLNINANLGQSLIATYKSREKPMADKIKAGSILIEEGTFLPESLRFESEPYSNSWSLVRNLDGYGLERKIRLAGWNFFYMAGEIKASVFGFDTEKVIHRAIKRVLADLKADKFNSVEIGQVTVDGFLGLRHVTVSAHPRHIQESVSLFHDKRLAERDRAKLVAV
jgi:hypothetical protein